MPLTMTAEREAYLLHLLPTETSERELRAEISAGRDELDATKAKMCILSAEVVSERAAHQETKAKLDFAIADSKRDMETIDIMNAGHLELEKELAETQAKLTQCQKALEAEWPDLDNEPEWTPEQLAEMKAEHAEFLQHRVDARKALFLAGAEAQRLEDSQRAQRFDAWFDLKEPRGKILSEEILAAPLAAYEEKV